MIPHARTETGRLVVRRSEISDEARRQKTSQDRILSERLALIDRQQSRAQAAHRRTVDRAMGSSGHDATRVQRTRSTPGPVQRPRKQPEGGALASAVPTRHSQSRSMATQRSVNWSPSVDDQNKVNGGGDLFYGNKAKALPQLEDLKRST